MLVLQEKTNKLLGSCSVSQVRGICCVRAIQCGSTVTGVKTIRYPWIYLPDDTVALKAKNLKEANYLPDFEEY